MVIKMNDIDKYGIEQSDKCAIAQMEVGQLMCNGLTINHYFQIGNFVARYDRLKDLKDDTIVLTLEAIK